MKKFLLILFALMSFACETFAATETVAATSLRLWGVSGGSGATQSYSAAASDACQLIGINYPTYKDFQFVGPSEPAPPVTVSALTCSGLWTGDNTSRFNLPGPTIYAGSTQYSCPDSSWTLSGSTCTRDLCPSGYERNAQGQCVKNCESFAGKPTPNGSGYDFSGAVPDWSVGGCKVKCNVKVLAVEGGRGSECSYTGASANPEQTEPEPVPPNPEKLPPESPKDCLGAGQGYITSSSGKTTCVAQEQAPEGQKPTEQKKDSEKEKGTPGPDGKLDPNASDYEKQTKSESNKDGKVTLEERSTKNGTPDGNGGVTCPSGYTLNADGKTCTKTTITTTNTSDYCKENPTSSVCKGTEASDECIKNPKRIGCFEGGTADDPGELTTHDFSPSVLPVELIPSSNSCPGDILLPGNQRFSFSSYCQLADMAKPIVLAFAWVLALFIVLGFSKGGNNG